MHRPVDAVSAAVLKLQMAQRTVNTLVDEVIERVSADPFAEVSKISGFSSRLSQLRREVDEAADELIAALVRLEDGEPAGGA